MRVAKAMMMIAAVSGNRFVSVDALRTTERRGKPPFLKELRERTPSSNGVDDTPSDASNQIQNGRNPALTYQFHDLIQSEGDIQNNPSAEGEPREGDSSDTKRFTESCKVCRDLKSRISPKELVLKKKSIPKWRRD